MKKKLGIVAGLLVALIAILFLTVAMQPADFSVTRSATIAAPPATVFPLVNNFHTWEQWSPWAQIDPAMKTTYEGPESGVGAVYSWVGNSEVGEGRMAITESIANEKILIDLEFKAPFEATNVTEFNFAPEGEGTKVTWTMTGTNNFIGKAFGLLMDMDAMVGTSFEQGLADMKAAAEGTSPEVPEAPAATE